MRIRTALVGLTAAAVATGAAPTAEATVWRWTTTQAEYYVGANGHPKLTATCRGLGKAYRVNSVARYARFRCVLTFPDGSAYSLVVQATGRTTYHLVSSHKLHGAGKTHGHDSKPPKQHT